MGNSSSTTSGNSIFDFFFKIAVLAIMIVFIVFVNSIKTSLSRLPESIQGLETSMNRQNDILIQIKDEI